VTVRRPLAAAAAAGIAFAVVGCSPTTTVSTVSQPPRTVSVSATGQADAVPDAARASITVEVTDPASAETAQQGAAGAATAVLDALSAAAVPDADIATQALTVAPAYTYTSDGGQTLIGYRASQTFTVTLRDLSTAGRTLDAVVAAGGNAARLDSFAPFVTDPTLAAAAARAQAVEIAQAQAQQYAELLGFTLGEVASVSEAASQVSPRPVAFAEDAAAAADKVTTPIEAGTTQVSVTLDVAWSIE
jgi:uncharacterized protein